MSTRWEAASTRPIAAQMTFEGEALLLGAQTRLAKAGAPLDEPRLGALLAAAHGREIAASSLRHIRRALETWRSDKPLALMHLALSGLARLANPKEDARRLFVADALIDAGVAPSVIVKGLGLDGPSSGERIGKYSPDQPRVPAGNPDGGQWTSGDGAGGSSGSRPQTQGVEVADASATHGHEVASDANPTATLRPLGDQSFEVAQNLDESCQSFIAANCQARIMRVFPGQYLACTLREVIDAAKGGDRAAQTACKLLFRKEYRK